MRVVLYQGLPVFADVYRLTSETMDAEILAESLRRHEVLTKARSQENLSNQACVHTIVLCTVAI